MLRIRCGDCKGLLEAMDGRGLVDAIVLHCREYHVEFGDNGAIFDGMNQWADTYITKGDEESETNGPAGCGT